MFIQTAITNSYANKLEERTKVEYVEREVQKIVKRPIYLNRCIDADGLQQINSLIEAKYSS